MDTGGKARTILRGVGVYAALSLMLAVIIWDVISFLIPPSNAEWALLFIGANAAFLIAGWYASRYWPRHLRVGGMTQPSRAKNR
jgi:hypothetical protein